ncbi:hypothetical protein [Amycolatopsis sp. NPDC021455]|uniref:hypothetical protein n=1 Tax=Amycolatopsis sp. NPDC021455 TaxID=3154901 RepID=UPI0033E78AC3
MENENPRRHPSLEEIEAIKEAEHARSMELAKKYAERDKDYVPSERSREILEILDEAVEEQKKLPVEMPARPERYDFAPGIAPDGTPYPVHERKSRRQSSGGDAGETEGKEGSDS